jgi:hypothetical protein
MLSGREIFRIVSIVVFSAGIICLPRGWPPPNPKSWTSNFLLMASAGEYFAIGVVLCVAGLLMIGLSYVPLPQRNSSSGLHRLIIAGLVIALASISFLYFDLFVRDSYTRSSLGETQNELRELAGLLGRELSPAKLENLAETQGLPFKRMGKSLHANIPAGASAYRCGKLTFFFDANEKLVDVRGHLLNHSLLYSDQPNNTKNDYPRGLRAPETPRLGGNIGALTRHDKKPGQYNQQTKPQTPTNRIYFAELDAHN